MTDSKRPKSSAYRGSVDMDPETYGTENHDARVVPTRDDEGKEVVGSNYRDIGMVTCVEGDTMYVDPNTLLSEQVKQKLRWDENRRTDLPIPPELVRRIEDEVVLAIERETNCRAEDR